MTDDFCCVIAAAGLGTRSRLKYPKTLYEIDGVPILKKILDNLTVLNKPIFLIINPTFNDLFESFMKKYNFSLKLIPQNSPKGMGDAVLQLKNSSHSEKFKNTLLIWGDIPFIRLSTIKQMISRHKKNKNIFTFCSRTTDYAYTRVVRNKSGFVTNVIETRESKDIKIERGERDIGLFMFNNEIVISALEEELDGKFSSSSREHGFLYIVNHLFKRGHLIEALNIASADETVSLNKLSDLEGHS